MTEAANAQHGHKVAGHRAAVPQRVVSRNAGAEHRRRFDVIQGFRYGDQGFYRCQHVALVSAVVADAGNQDALTVAKISATALKTCAVMAAVPADTDALSLLPVGDISARFVDDAHDFVSRNPGILEARP